MLSDKEREIEDRLSNIEKVIEEIKRFPHTYDTILGEFRKNGTYKFILKRKLSRICEYGGICKTVIPGTRFGRVIFFSLPKKYFIVVESGTIGVNVYVFFKYIKSGKFNIIVDECWMLDDYKWKKLSEKKILFEGKILKMV